ncbi:LytR/AlgR family response regulator transcription factor [Usitatibacter palustris]|uniref:Transcriptional regulatory protein BtsR n=1 Tax=Usitatibacter palustris TaxID=2732487 RepID=A0A6M4H7R8_9PROT|nr:LytTR family DNA-binding domain-containing protein [Usitatibacter palustris]QJR14037.1 Transcriptional regulatory protein BtsR [Usitatibacter palustris]
MTRAVIAEDEGNLREQLRETLASVWPELDVVAEAADGIEALRALEEHAPDVLFLDIQMPGLSGLEVARHASGRSHVVFVTAFDQYAVSAFEQGAIDYVMKPLSASRVAETVRRLREREQSAPANLEGLLQSLAGRLQGHRREYLRWITASQGSETRLITMDEIFYFQSDNKYTVVATADRESLIRVPIRELAEQLDPETFWQIHRGTLVNVNHIAGVSRTFRGHMELRLKQRPETLAVSESYAHLFRQM